MAGFEWLSRGRRSDKTERANDGVMMCGRAVIGSDIVPGSAAVKSFAFHKHYFQTGVAYGTMPTFFIKFVASMRTSVSGPKVWTAPR